MDGPVECLKVLPCVDINHRPHVTFLGPRDAWHKVAHKYKHLFEMETKIAYDWLTFWVNAFIQVSKNALLIDPKMQRTE